MGIAVLEHDILLSKKLRHGQTSILSWNRDFTHL